MQNSFSKIKSFTLIETLVAIFVFALAMVAVAGLIVLGYRTHGFTKEQSIAIEEAQRGIEKMVKEIREAKSGDDGSFPIEKADDKEFIFYSDIDDDGEVERVRYFLGNTRSGSQTQECVSFLDGGSCNVVFSNFLEGDLISAQLEVSVEGDFGWSQEYAEIYTDGTYLGSVCKTTCSDCAGTWEGTTTFDVTLQAEDDLLSATADATSRVNSFCDWEDPNHSMKARFKLTWTENLSTGQSDLKKGVIDPVGLPVQYPSDQEKITILSSYVRNSPPIFEYFDKDGNKIESLPARLADTKLMKIFLVIDVNPDRSPSPFELESWVQIRNLKEE